MKKKSLMFYFIMKKSNNPVKAGFYYLKYYGILEL